MHMAMFTSWEPASVMLIMVLTESKMGRLRGCELTLTAEGDAEYSLPTFHMNLVQKGPVPSVRSVRLLRKYKMESNCPASFDIGATSS